MRQLKITQQITQRDASSVTLYLQEVSRYDMVSTEEEVELTVRIRNGDEAALRRLVEANLRFVISVAKQYQNQGLTFGDLISEGNVGLVKSAKRFDETRGFKFISYAVWWIRQSIMQAISEHTRVVRLPLNRLTTMKKISKATTLLEQYYEREPSDDELAEYLSISQNLVLENDQIKNKQVSFDLPLSSDGESKLNLYDLIPSDSNLSPDSGLISESLRINLSRAMSKLSEREASVINMSFGLNNHKPQSLYDIACQLDISTERVRQIRSLGLMKLKRVISLNHCFQNNF